MKKRFIEIDICKAICIILVVIGHSGCPPFIHHFLNLFHMAVFFSASGFCYSKKHDYEPFKYLLRKIKSIYIPFLIFGLILSISHNFLLKINIYTVNPDFLKLPYGNSAGIIYPYNLNDLLSRFVRIMSFVNTEQLAGATWFLRILFLVSIFHCFSRYLFIKITKSEKNIDIYSILLGIICLFIGSYFNEKSIHFLFDTQVFFVSYFAFIIGIIFKKIINSLKTDTKISTYFIIVIFSLIILLTYGNKGTLGVGSNSIINPLFFATMSITGFLFIYSISKILVKLFYLKYEKFFNLFIFIGRNTLIILFLHFLAFKVVTLFQILLTNKPFIYLSCFPVADPTHGQWIMYVLAGLTLPLIYQLIYEKIAYIFKRKLVLLTSRYN